MVGAGSSDGAGACLAEGAEAVGAGGVAAGGAGALGAGGGTGCSDGIAASLPDGIPTVGAGVVNEAVGATDTPVAGGTDCSGNADCRPLMKRESSRLATSSRPTDRTTTDRATQLNLILTA